MQRVFGPGSGYAKESFRNRWAMAVPAFATHLSIGSPWAWSVVSDSVSRDLGFVTAAAECVASRVASQCALLWWLTRLS